MAQLKYTPDGYPYYEADSEDTFNNNPLYPQQQITVSPQSVQTALPVTIPDTPFTAGINAFKNLTLDKSGERIQTWPERMVRSGLTLAGDVKQGNVLSGPGLRREDYTDLPVATEPNENSTWLGQKLGLAPVSAQPLDPMMERAQDMAGLAGGATFGIKPGEASVGSGLIRNEPKLTPIDHDPFVDPRLVRAKEQGFHIDEPVYHETNAEFNEFKPSYGTSTWFTTDKNTLGQNGAAGTGKVIEAYLKHKKLAGWNEYDKYTTDQLISMGYDGARLGKDIVIFDPKNIRRIDAKFDPKNVGKSGLLLSDTATPGAPLAALENAPVFYSALENAVKNAKQNVATADQWLGYLKNQPGVKAEELDWTLGSLPKGKLTKAELEQHINDHKVDLKEVNKGELKFDKNSPYALPEVIKAAKEAGDTPGDLELVLANDGNAYRALTKKFPKLIEDENWAETVSNSVFGGDSMPKGTTKYHGYQLPGGENYREMLLTLPEKKIDVQGWRAEKDPQGYKNDWLIYDDKNNVIAMRNAINAEQAIEKAQSSLSNGKFVNNFTSSHWDEPNILAHIRMNDRIVDGKKTLHIEEVQSDWHQKGRKEGYKTPDINDPRPELKKANDELNALDSRYPYNGEVGYQTYLKSLPEKERILHNKLQEDIKRLTPEVEQYEKIARGNDPRVPNAPFKKTWDELALKKIIRHAAENGYDAISWTPGEAQAARYDLSKQISAVHYSEKNDLKAFDHNGNVVVEQMGVKPEELQNYIGKEGAEKLLSQPEQDNMPIGWSYANNKILRGKVRMLEGQDLKVGGEGMKAFYDKMLVDKANNLAKKFGSKVETKHIGMHYNPANKPKTIDDLNGRFDHPIHYLPLTPGLKDTALKKGFPLFSAGMSFTPVEHNPFEDQK